MYRPGQRSIFKLDVIHLGCRWDRHETASKRWYFVAKNIVRFEHRKTVSDALLSHSPDFE